MKIDNQRKRRQAEARRIQEALAQLPDSYREVVTLRDVQELSYEEVAEITALPLGTVKSRIHRGRSALQDALRHIHDSGTATFSRHRTHS